MSPSPSGGRVIRCPACGGPSRYAAENAFRPFCSARCKNNDFGAWASEGYRVATEPNPDDADAGTESREPRDPLPH